MGLEKAILLNTETGKVVSLQFNPEEYSLDAGNSFAEFSVVGLSKPPIQYIRGSGRSLRIELFFDTSDQQSDVRAQTLHITSLLDKIPKLGAPPRLVFSWGGFDFSCVLEKVLQRHTHFLPNGKPQRAYLSTTFREYAAASVEIKTVLPFVPTTVRNLTGNETLSGIAGELLGNPAAWRELASRNGIDNPRTMTSGSEGRVKQLIVPVNVRR